MKYEILHKGTFPIVKVDLESGETIKAESGAMVSMSPNIGLEGNVEGGILKGLGRMLAGEKFFFQKLTAKSGAGEVLLAPSQLGDVFDVEVEHGHSLVVQKDGFLAATEGIQIDTKMQNLSKGFFSGEGFFVLNISGQGRVFLNTYGSVHTIEIEEGQEVIIDNGHLVAWEDSIQYTVEKAASGWVSSFTSGEMLVCRFKGPGKVFIQTRNPSGFGELVRKYAPSK